jgi:hypothetical protein
MNGQYHSRIELRLIDLADSVPLQAAYGYSEGMKFIYAE